MSMPVPMSDDPNAIRAATLQGQIIVGALIAGLVTFLVVVIVITMAVQPGAPGAVGPGAQPAHAADAPLPIITYLAVAMGAVLLPASFVVPVMVSRAQRRAIAAGKVDIMAIPNPPPGEGLPAVKNPVTGMPAIFLAQMIIGAAMAEGPGFFALIAYLVEKNPICLAMAVLLIIGVVVRFPTTGRVEAWCEQQREMLRAD
jgi:hypothetical protein